MAASAAAAAVAVTKAAAARASAKINARQQAGTLLSGQDGVPTQRSRTNREGDRCGVLDHKLAMSLNRRSERGHTQVHMPMALPLACAFSLSRPATSHNCSSTRQLHLHQKCTTPCKFWHCQILLGFLAWLSASCVRLLTFGLHSFLCCVNQ